jgi:uncharacterized membrane protein YkvI
MTDRPDTAGLDMFGIGRTAASLMLLAFGLLLLFPDITPDADSFSLPGWKAPLVAASMAGALYVFPREGALLRIGGAVVAFLLITLWALAWSRFSFSL